MTGSGPAAALVSLEAARAALGRMMSSGSIASRAPSVTMAVRSAEAWSATEGVLQQVTGRADLTGQALLAEARRQERLGLDDAHAIIALHDWVERTRAPGSAAQMLTLPPTEAEREVAGNALKALETSVGAITGDAALPPRADGSPPPPFVSAPQPVGAGDSAVSQWAAPRSPSSQGASQSRAVPPKPAPSAAQLPMTPVPVIPVDEPSIDDGDRRRSRSSAMMVVALLLVAALAGAAGWYFLRSNGARGAGSTEEGVAAYSRGSIETARLALVRAVQENPDDVRALTFLGRITREQGDLPAARKYLESAIRVDPQNALALRELGSSLLAENQPELARRFYVRALGVNANDRVAQGFLACALARLGRADEAARWAGRAGPGDWSACATATPAAPAPAR